jgi:LysM domain-containing protein
MGWAQSKATVPAQGHPPRNLSHLPDGHWSANTQSDQAEGSQTHVVKAGDTLWDVTKQYLKDPYLWPQVWEINPNIRNPHWIYPGDHILIKQMVVMKTPPETTPAEPKPELPQTPAPTPAVATAPTPAAEGEVATAEVQQTAPTPKAAASFSDVYCAGFFSADEIKPDKIIVGGEESETKSFFHDRDVIYISQGGDVRPGEEYLVLRRMKDFGKYGPMFGKAKSRYGHYYQDIGRVKILLAHENSATAEVVSACEEMKVSDFLVSNEQRTIPLARIGSAFDKFAPPNNKTAGKIFMTKEYRKLIGAGHIVFIDVGQKQEVHVGDYFRITRHLDSSNISLFNRGAYRQYRNSFDSVRKIVGEVVILRTEANTSTALVTLSTEDVALGDGVELE